MNVMYEMICEKNTFVEYRYSTDGAVSGAGSAVFTKDGLAYVVEKAARNDTTGELANKLAKEVARMAKTGAFSKKGLA